MDTNDKKDQNYQLSTTDDEKNDKTKYSIDPSKKLPSTAEKVETALFGSIAAVPIVSTKAPVFQVIEYMIVYHQFLHQGNHNLLLQ